MVTNTIPCWFVASQELAGHGPGRSADIEAKGILHRALVATVQVELIANIQMGCQHIEQGP